MDYRHPMSSRIPFYTLHDSHKQIARYGAWRMRRRVDRPMIGLLWEPDILPLPGFIESVGDGASVFPEHVRPEMYLPHVERWQRRAADLSGDTIQRLTPGFGIPWMEAIAGCPIVAHPGSLWAGQCLRDYRNRRPIRFSPDNPWLQKLLECTRAMVELADGQFPIAVPQMRGPLDILAAMRTPAQMCLDVLESPDDVQQVLAELTDLYIAVGEAVLAEIPPFRQGYVTRMNMWVPDKALTLQNDVSTLISARVYRQLVQSFDRKIASRFHYTDFHMHSTEHHQIDAVLEEEEVTAIQLALEHTVGGPPLETMLAAARRILNKKPLLLACPDRASAERCIRELPPAGLCIMIVSSDEDTPSALNAWMHHMVG